MEAEWVRIAPYLGVELPETAVNYEYPGVRESKEVFDYFSSIDKERAVDLFRDFYGSLSATPRLGQTKMQQIIEAVRLQKLADKIHAEMDQIGLKR